MTVDSHYSNLPITTPSAAESSLSTVASTVCLHLTMSYAILTLTNARIEHGASVIERHLSKALSMSESKVTVMLEDDNSATSFCTQTMKVMMHLQLMQN